MAKIKAYLALATGRVFEGEAFGAAPSDKSFGEVVFNTSLTGYQEILTDPSYNGQMVVMTGSHVGNYGINPEDVESRKLYLSGFIVQELSRTVSNYRSTMSLDQYLRENGVTGITGIDTRALTRHLRTQGAVNGLITLDGKDLKGLIRKAKALPSMEGQDLVPPVTSTKSYTWNEGLGSWSEKKNTSGKGKKVVVLDFGAKQNILRCLAERGCEVTVVPAKTPADEILAQKPDGVLLSNGPGDPACVTYGIKTIKELADKKMPMFGICLGHQMLGLALGGETYKLKFGHHGANHPIKDLETGQVDITTQNHGFAVKAEQKGGEWTLKGNKDVLVTHINLNDQSAAGLRHKTKPVFSVQYHPEAAAGPHDAQHLFDRFMKLMDKKEN
jgi:carbamoyl-phosphate synthase small subunit